MTSTTRNIVGIHKIHHSPDRRYCIPIRINVPSDRESAGSPTPRKDSVASSRIDVAALIVGAKQEPGARPSAQTGGNRPSINENEPRS